MKVTLLSQWFPRGSVAHSIAEAIRDAGADVSVVTGPEFLPDWSVGRREWRMRREDCGAIPVVRYPYYRSHTGSGIKRFLSYASFAASTASRGQREIGRSDVILVYSSPATAAAAAMLSQFLRGTPYVLLVQDLWPDSVYATGFLTHPLAHRLCDASLGRFVGTSYRRASAVVGISPSMRRTLVRRGVPAGKAHSIYNWAADEGTSQRISVPPRIAGAALHLMYAGTLGPAQDLDAVLRVFARLPQNMARLSLLGSGIAESSLRATAHRLGLANVHFLGRVPRDEVPRHLADAHLHLITLADRDPFRTAIPSKLQSLAARGAPILCVAPGDTARIVTENGMGLACEPGSPTALERTIRKAADLSTADLRRMGTNSAHHYASEMSRDRNAAALMEILRSAAQSTGPATRWTGSSRRDALDHG